MSSVLGGVIIRPVALLLCLPNSASSQLAILVVSTGGFRERGRKRTSPFFFCNASILKKNDDTTDRQ